MHLAQLAYKEFLFTTMPPNKNQVSQEDFDALQQQVNTLSLFLDSHNHDGVMSEKINMFDVSGMFQTSITATETAQRLAASPVDVFQQVFIDTSTATKKLYIYNARAAAWLSCTIS